MSSPRKSSNEQTYAPPNLLSAKKEREYEVVRPSSRQSTTRPPSTTQSQSSGAVGGTPGVDRPPTNLFVPTTKRAQNDPPSATRSSDINRLQSNDSANPSVYHLAHQDIKPPSPAHRKRLNEWYEEHKTSRNSEDTEDAYTRNDTMQSHSMERSAERRGRRRGGFWRIVFGHSAESDGSDTLDGQGDGVFRMTSTAEFSTEGLNTVTSYMQENLFGEEEYLKTKQETAYLTIGLTSIQLLILCLQLAMCGIASFDINPFIGTYPSEISEWGGKNAYLMIEKQQWWRLVTPSFLHVGVLHLLANAFCQLEPIALFEREWGSTRWFILYMICSVGSSGFSCLMDPDSIAVGSSGALMGMFSAKFAQVLSHLLFEVNKVNQDDMVRFDQLSSVVCGLILVSVLSCFTYIEWSGHMGGLATGFFGGMLLFCNPIRSCCVKFFWALIGLCGVAGFLTYVFYSILFLAEPANEDLANACEYFRAFFPEDYECGCSLW